jgi:hypothetical protein
VKVNAIKWKPSSHEISSLTSRAAYLETIMCS